MAEGHGTRLAAPFLDSVPAWLRVLVALTAIEPVVLLPFGLLASELLMVAVLGGLFLTLPTLAVFALAVLWGRALAQRRALPGLPAGLTGPAAARVAGIALVVSTIGYLLVLVLLVGWWAALALPPAALALASARLMVARWTDTGHPRSGGPGWPGFPS